MRYGVTIALAFAGILAWGVVSAVLPGTGSLEPGLAFAADDGEKTAVKGSVSKGKYYFKKTCKSCHTPKAEGGEVTPMSKTIKQWERYFKKGVHRKIGEGDEKIKEPPPKRRPEDNPDLWR